MDRGQGRQGRAEEEVAPGGVGVVDAGRGRQCARVPLSRRAAAWGLGESLDLDLVCPFGPSPLVVSS